MKFSVGMPSLLVQCCMRMVTILILINLFFDYFHLLQSS